MESQFTETERLDHGLKAIRQYMKHGNLIAMDHLLADIRSVERIKRMGKAEDVELLACACSWAHDARDYEREHGSHSMLDRGDPFVREVILPLIARHSAAQSVVTASASANLQGSEHFPAHP